MQLSKDVMSDLGGSFHSRRAILRAGAIALEMLGTASLVSGLSGCSSRDQGSSSQGALAGILLSHVIPPTATPGAGNQSNLEFILRAIDSGLMGSPTDTLAKLEAELDGQAMTVLQRRGFMNQAPDRQAAVLTDLDRRIFSAPITFPCPWFTTKALILMSYFTSEAGASQQLAYDLAPGRYDRDVVITADWRPLSNDYAANSIKKRIA